MRIGIPKEIKDKENRVAMTPEGVSRLVKLGNELLIESKAGEGSGFTDQHYLEAGAKLVSAAQAWASDLVVKVKEPLPVEYGFIDQQMIFTFFHLSGVEISLTHELLKKRATAIAYETLEDANGGLPILAPMSAIAGNMAALMGNYYLATFNHGKGVQLASVLGKSFGKVLVIGDGVVGQHAAKVAAAMGATVYIAGLNTLNYEKIRSEVSGNLHFLLSNTENIQSIVREVDVVIGAVLSKGAKAPKIVTEAMVKAMQPGSVVVDVSVDQGGCFETSRPTTHSQPIYILHDVIHYCVANMPGAYARTATIALARETIGYVEKIAVQTFEDLISDKGFAKAINIYKGKITYEQIAHDLGMQEHYKKLF